MTGNSLSANLKATGKVGSQKSELYRVQTESSLDIYLTNSDKAFPCKIPRNELENRKWLSLPTVDKSLPFDKKKKKKKKVTLFLLSSSKYYQKRVTRDK